MLDKQILCRLKHAPGVTCEDCGGFKQCAYCFTEYRIERPAADRMLITVWCCLGIGQSPDEPKWKRFCESHQPPVCFEVGSNYKAWISQETPELR